MDAKEHRQLQQAYKDALEQMGNAIELKVRQRPWHQVISMAGERSDLNQLFTWDLAEYYIGYKMGKHLLVGKNDVNGKFVIANNNLEAALQEALEYIRRHYSGNPKMCTM